MPALRPHGSLNARRLPLLFALAAVVACAPTATTASPPKLGTLDASSTPPPQAGPASADADDPLAVGLSSTIRKVTVYSDRALVTREAVATLAAGSAVLAFRQLPAWVDESSVRVAANVGRIVDVRVGRRYLARATEESYQKAEAEANELTGRMAALDDELKVLDAQAKQVEDIKAFSLDKLNKDVVAGNVGVPTYSAVVDFVGKSLRETAKGRRAVHTERERLAPEVAASKRRLDDLKGLTQLEETRVFVTLDSPTPAETHVVLSYMLPGATWETAHELRAAGSDPTSAEVTSFAVVTQASGEDWNNADLTFSTQSSTTAVRIPELTALTLGESEAQTQSIERQSASFRRAQTAFEGQNRLWNMRAQSADLRSFEESYQTNFEYLQTVQSKTVEIFQSLQQRGTTAQFKAMTTTIVRADGRSVRVPIGRVQLKARQSIVAAPEQSLNAAETLEMVNESGQALLPGSVALYQGGTFLGMTNLDFVADGEPFAVFLSVADQLKLSRTLDKRHSSLVKKQRSRMQLAFIVSVENLSSRATTLKLADRIPVSEDKDITISGVKITPDVAADSKGILRWPVTLQPREKRTFEIQYQIEYPPTLVLEMRRSPAPPAPSRAAHHGSLPMPATPAPAAPYDLKQDIERLEHTL
jgi:uncharacterized protein (TIGR02231 family)